MHLQMHMHGRGNAVEGPARAGPVSAAAGPGVTFLTAAVVRVRRSAAPDRSGPADASDRTVLVQSFSEASLRRLHELRPELPLVRLFSGDGPPRPPDGVLVRTAEYAVAIGPNRGRVDAALVEAARRHELEVHPWTVNDEAEMKRLVELGVGGLFTDHPGRLRQLLQGR